MRNVLIGTNHHHTALVTADTAHIENVTDTLVIDTENFFVVLQTQLASFWFQ
jgi:hypothetical protein